MVAHSIQETDNLFRAFPFQESIFHAEPTTVVEETWTLESVKAIYRV